MRRPRTGVVGFIALVVALASVFVLGGAASSTPGPSMKLNPELLEVAGLAGETFSIDVLIDDVTNLGGFEFQLNFDETIANLEIQVGPFLGSSGAQVNCINIVNLGIATLGCVKFGGPPGPSGSGVVAVLNFRLKLPFAGIGQLFLQACNAADPDGNPIPLNGCKNGSFVVPTPDPVGGVAVDPHQTLLTLDRAEGPAGGLTWRTTSLATGAGALLTAVTAIWYVRRRRPAS